jgi:hypothetical protein
MQMTDKQCITKISFVQTWADDVPLYTHPAKTLTDEEIMALWKPMPDTKVYVRDLYAFARAILRKAQEK